MTKTILEDVCKKINKEEKNYIELNIAFDPYLIQYYFVKRFFQIQCRELKCVKGRYFLELVDEPLWYECG